MVALVALTALSMAVADQRYLSGERTVLEQVNALPGAVGGPLRVVMQLGTLAVALVVVVLVARATWARGPAPTLAVLVAVAIAFRLDNVLKDVIDRPRPPDALTGLDVREAIDGFGFPSGHTTMAFAVAAALHPLLARARRWALWVLATLVGVARMYVGVHWPADVAGGAALGTAIGSAAWLAVTWIAGRGDAPAPIDGSH